MKKVETNKTKEAKSFRDDILKFMQTLNGVDDENLTPEEAEILRESVEEFASQFIYFRESYTQKNSHIRHISALMEDIRELVGESGEKYEEAEDLEESNTILFNAVNEVIGKLSEVEKNLEEAEKEESEFKRIESIERMFVQANLSVQGSEETIKKMADQIKDQMVTFREGVESNDLQLAIIEKNTIDFKQQCDTIIKTFESFSQHFDESKEVSQKKLDELFTNLVEQVNQTKTDIVGEREKELDALTGKYNEALDKIETKSDEALGKMERFNGSGQYASICRSFKQLFL
jgi:hypothetical protein